MDVGRAAESIKLNVLDCLVPRIIHILFFSYCQVLVVVAEAGGELGWIAISSKDSSRAPIDLGNFDCFIIFHTMNEIES